MSGASGARAPRDHRSIETPSLRARLTLVTVGLVVVTVVALDLVVYLSLRDELDERVEEVLDTRVALAEQIVETGTGDVADELAEFGIPAVVTRPDGTVLRSDPVTRRFDVVPPGGDPASDAVASRVLPLADGTTIEILVSRAGAAGTLREVAFIELAGTAGIVIVAGLLLRRVTAVMTRPLDRMVETASLIASGQYDQRLRPSDPTTELGRLAEAFDQTFDALERAIDHARRAETRSRRFLSDAAHQLRTPLAGLRASAETLLADPEGPDRAVLIGNVGREATRMSRLVDSLLRVAHIDRGERPSLRPTDPRLLVADEVERQRDLAPSLTFTTRPLDDPPIVHCDPALVREALANLLDNARRHARTSIEVDVAGVADGVELRVRDDGPGLADELRDSAFERFTSGAGGSGLGLPIALGIARAHGGDLLHRGGDFVLSLPAPR